MNASLRLDFERNEVKQSDDDVIPPVCSQPQVRPGPEACPVLVSLLEPAAAQPQMEGWQRVSPDLPEPLKVVSII